MPELGPTTRLAVGRTVMAADRTLMAWVRTSLSMFSFGFTLYKIIQGLEEGVTALPIDLHPARAGMILSGLGIISISIGIIEYHVIIGHVRKIMPYKHWRYSLIMAYLMLLTGIAIFFGIMMRLL